MFEGFNGSTVRYFQAISMDNRKSTHRENQQLYLDGVKRPLEELYEELYTYFSKVDGDLLSNKRRCISTAYNDARFCRDAPMKEYFYIRFQAETARRKNILGFFLDASLSGYSFGLALYHADAGGMERIRDAILDNRQSAQKTIERFQRAGLLEVRGEKYKRPCYPEENEVLREWLERRSLSFVRGEALDRVFFERELLYRILTAFDSAREPYFMIKEALATEAGAGLT